MKKQKDWFKIKRYPHIGPQLSYPDRGWVSKYIKDEKNIAIHSFYPFIHRQLAVRKFRKEISHDGTRSILRKLSNKKRELFYANHLDSNIFSYYAKILSEKYNEILSIRGISECVTAYRAIPLNPTESDSRNKCNIDFANEVFCFITSQNEDKLVAITFDIKSFFDSLNHKILKSKWKTIIGSEHDLPKHHYNVYKNITNFSYVEENEIFKTFQDRIIVERKPSIVKKIPVKKKKYLRNARAIAFCELKDIGLLRQKKLIKSNKYHQCKKCKNLIKREQGIPQGSPISAVLANIYMLDFDTKANELASEIGGIYRRYSDDMVVICSANYEQKIIDFFTEEISLYKLEIQPNKTQVFHFNMDKKDKRYYCYEKNLNTNNFSPNTNFEYLGFQFDGYYTLLKDSSLSNYYRKMKRTFAHGRFYTYHNNTSTKGELFKNRLYKRFTHIGAQRRRIYKRDKNDTDKFVLSHKYDWGNFLTYANLAAKIIPNNKIKKQIRKSWHKFHKIIESI